MFAVSFRDVGRGCRGDRGGGGGGPCNQMQLHGAVGYTIQECENSVRYIYVNVFVYSLVSPSVQQT